MSVRKSVYPKYHCIDFTVVTLDVEIDLLKPHCFGVTAHRVILTALINLSAGAAACVLLGTKQQMESEVEQ